MTKAMPFLQKAILLSYAPRTLALHWHKKARLPGRREHPGGIHAAAGVGIQIYHEKGWFFMKLDRVWRVHAF